MKHEVFVLGGQRINHKNEKKKLGEMRKGRRERIEKGCHCFFKSSGPQGMTSWSSSIKICFLQAYRMHYYKKCHGVKQNAKIFAIGEQNVANEN